ncbi:AraC family transcriptional regulator [Paenibacillus sp. FSL K6-3182]|uniref:AraC family transcriptional regulator n=1 Tax=Paenibacillus sp. FSL K6-3182 TaxID=2921495 RepID=UPI0030D1417C
MKFEEQIAIWNHSAAKIFDIRHTVMNAGECMVNYRFPASGFIFGVRGSAHLILDDVIHQTRRSYLLHGSKGMILEIEAKEEFEFYFLFYRAKLAFSGWREMRQWLERKSPFEIQYGFEPEEPRAMLFLMSSMEQTLKNSGSLGSVEIKGLFYQFVHEVLRNQKTFDSKNGQKDLVKLVIRYLHNHYQEGITLDFLANQYNYSPRYLSTKFKQQTGASPIEYLIQIRINESKKLLLETRSSLRVIASQVGYADEYYFSRLFKKQTGLSPVRYQAMEREKATSEDSPRFSSKLSIGASRLRRYSVIGSDNHYQYKSGGFISMKRNKKSLLILSTLLSLTLLLGACSSGGTNVGTNSTGSAVNVTATASPNSETVSEEGTRTISTIKGDVIVPANPKRVVVLYMLGDIVALGVNPIGISEVYDGAAFSEQLKGAESLGHWDETSPEAVMALDPDLIIVNSENSYSNLKDIAPTVLIAADQVSTEERIMKLGEVFGKEKEAKAFLDDFNNKVELSKEKLRSAGILDKTITIVEGDKKEMLVIESKQYGRGSQIVYDYLGMKGPEIIQKKLEKSKAAESQTISMEVMPQYVGDILLRSSWEGMDDLSDNPVWSSIAAVKEKRVIEAPFGLFYYTDIYSLRTQLDMITDSLLATAAGK